jgi:plasmid stabilization system protein ParE
MTNASRQAAWRDRHKGEIETLRNAALDNDRIIEVLRDSLLRNAGMVEMLRNDNIAVNARLTAARTEIRNLKTRVKGLAMPKKLYKEVTACLHPDYNASPARRTRIFQEWQELKFTLDE